MTVPGRRPSLDGVTSILLAAMLLACLCFACGQGFGVDPWRAALPAVAVTGLLVARAVTLHRGQCRGAAAATAFLQMTLFTELGVVLAYAIAAHPAALWDARLAAADRALGFDWPAILATLDGWPVVVAVLAFAYHSLSVQMVVAILALAQAGRLDTLRVAVCAAVLSGFVTILVSAVMPAAGNLFDPAHYRHLWPSIAWAERGLVAGLRDGSDRVLDLSALMGIVSFPSYHATLAALFVWCARDLPRLRLGLTVWAVLTIVATPVFGGHYAVEVIAGLLLAPPAVAAAQLVRARLDAPARRRGDAPRTVLRPGHELR